MWHFLASTPTLIGKSTAHLTLRAPKSKRFSLPPTDRDDRDHRAKVRKTKTKKTPEINEENALTPSCHFEAILPCFAKGIRATHLKVFIVYFSRSERNDRKRRIAESVYCCVCACLVFYDFWLQPLRRASNTCCKRVKFSVLFFARPKKCQNQVSVQAWIVVRNRIGTREVNLLKTARIEKKKYFPRARENLIAASLLNNQIACEMCLSTVSCRESFAHSAQRRASNAWNCKYKLSGELIEGMRDSVRLTSCARLVVFMFIAREWQQKEQFS